MAFNDPIADLLTRIRNAMHAQRRFVDVDLSKMKKSIVQILKENGFIDHYLVDETKKRMRIFLKYTKGRRSVLHGLKRISRPGLRRYVGYEHIPLEGVFKLPILSTSHGVLDGRKAREMKVGGELLCYIW